MKKQIALLLIMVLVFSLASCAATPQKNDYTLSVDAKGESIIAGVMTELSGADPVLKRTTASWIDNCVLYEVNIRQFTDEGTFKAFESHLDRLKDMGINTLWLMPIHPISETERKGSLGSYYSVSDYRSVNPEFGTEDDFRHLMDTAHEKGFHVMLDWVANHTGWDNAWIKEHEDWYVHDKKGEIESPYDWTDTAQLDYSNYEMRAEMIDCMCYWVEEFGIDGFRCDHAVGVPAPFWNAAVYKLKSINSEIMMLAEAGPAESLTTYAFDAVYNDPLYGQAMMIRSGVDTASIQDGMVINERYAEGSFPMNYLDNHDKNSYTDSVIGLLKETYPTLLSLTFLTPGVPLIYSSDEEGYDHCIEFFEKDPIQWDDNPKFAPLIQTLSKLKNDNAALDSTNPDLEILKTSDPNLFAFLRTKGDSRVLYVANLFYEEIKDASFKADFDNATCAVHYDGTNSDLEETTMTAADFEKKTYAPYECYVLVLK